ncbi:MAG: Tll0287-like domain-containing protein [Thermochromatium sp.]
MNPIARPLLAATGLYLLTALTPVLASADDPMTEEAKQIVNLTEEAKQIVKEFAQQLLAELKSAIESGGPTEAIAVCNERAPAIAAELSESSGWEVGRTSLKTRNTVLNTPDAWEREVLESFEARLAAGQPIDTLTRAEVVNGERGRMFRFMKAIPTVELCLTCHGEHIADPVIKALDEHYPDDRARGFKVGDIRGAFTLSKPLTD